MSTIVCPECGAEIPVVVTVAGAEEPRPRWRSRLLRLALWVAVAAVVAGCIWWVVR